MDGGSERGGGERGARRGQGGTERQVFNKLISFPMLLCSLSLILALLDLIGGKVRRAGGDPQPFCLFNCCSVFVITVKSSPSGPRGGAVLGWGGGVFESRGAEICGNAKDIKLLD